MRKSDFRAFPHGSNFRPFMLADPIIPARPRQALTDPNRPRLQDFRRLAWACWKIKKSAFIFYKQAFIFYKQASSIKTPLFSINKPLSSINKSLFSKNRHLFSINSPLIFYKQVNRRLFSTNRSQKWRAPSHAPSLRFSAFLLALWTVVTITPFLEGGDSWHDFVYQVKLMGVVWSVSPVKDAVLVHRAGRGWRFCLWSEPYRLRAI